MHPIMGRVLSRAKSLVRSRSNRRAPEPVAQIFDYAGISVHHREACAVLLDALGAHLGIDPRVLRASDKLGDVLGVAKSELQLSQEEASEWEKWGFEERLEPHSYELLETLQQITTQEGWRAQWNTLSAPPRSDDQWLNFIMGMTIADFVSFFSPAIGSRVPGPPAVD